MSRHHQKAIKTESSQEKNETKLLRKFFVSALVATIGTSILFLGQNCGQFKSVSQSSQSIGSRSESWVQDIDSKLSPFSQNCRTHRDSTGSGSSLSPLSPREFKNTVNDLVDALVSESEATVIKNQLQGQLDAMTQASITSDLRVFENALQNVGPTVTTERVNFVIELAEKLASANSLISATCTESASECFQAFLDSKALYFFRKPLTAQERQRYTESFENHGIEITLASMLLGPHFQFHIEESIGDAIGEELSLYELASRISYGLTGSFPDAELFAAVANQSLAIPEVLASQARRLLESAKGRNHLRQFVREWLQTQNIPELSSDHSRSVFLWEQHDNKPSESFSVLAGRDFKRALEKELEDLFLYHFLEDRDNGSFSALMTSRRFVADDLLKRTIYEFDAISRDPASESSYFDEGDRSGLISRAGLQIVDGESRRPIIKGVRLLSRILCQDLPSQADTSAPEESIIQPHFSQRELVEAMTEIKGSSCLACHQMINPIGFAQEAFDAFGRRSAFDYVIDQSIANPSEVIRVAPVNTVASLQLSSSSAQLTGPQSLAQFIASSPEAKACFTRFAWSFLNRRAPEEGLDACHLQDSFEKLESKKGLIDAFIAIVKHPNFAKKNAHTGGD